MATNRAEAERSSHEAETSSSSDRRASQSTGSSEGDLIQSNDDEKGKSKKEDRKGGIPTVELTNEPSENEGVMDQSSRVAKVRKRSKHAEQSSDSSTSGEVSPEESTSHRARKKAKKTSTASGVELVASYHQLSSNPGENTGSQPCSVPGQITDPQSSGGAGHTAANKPNMLTLMSLPTNIEGDRKVGIPTVELTIEHSENEGTMDQSNRVVKVCKRSSHAEQSSDSTTSGEVSPEESTSHRVRKKDKKRSTASGYRDIGTILLDDRHGDQVDVFEHNKKGNVQDVILEIYKEWLRQDSNSWTILTRCLRQCGLNSLASSIEKHWGIPSPPPSSKKLKVVTTSYDDEITMVKRPRTKAHKRKKLRKMTDDSNSSTSDTESDDSSSQVDELKNLSRSESKKLKVVCIEFFGRLCCVMKYQDDIAAKFQSNRLISRSVMSKLLTMPWSAQEKTIKLISAINKRIESKPARLYTFIQLLLVSDDLIETGRQMWNETGRVYFDIHGRAQMLLSLL